VEGDELIESLEIEYSRLTAHIHQLLKAGGFIIQELDKFMLQQREISSQLGILTGEVPIQSVTLSSVNKTHIEKTLQDCNGNKSQTARVLGINRRALLRRVYKYGLGNEGKKKGREHEGVTSNSTN